MATQMERVNALAELDRLGYKWEAIGDDEIRVSCPAHDDKSPSAALNTKTNLWKCHVPSCGAKGDIVTFMAFALKVERRTIYADLASRYQLETTKRINPELVETWHQAIWAAGPLLKALKQRGITEPMIRKARLGEHEGRITIPVFDLAGNVVNLRRYLPGAPGPEKYRNTKGFGTDPKLYQPDQLKHDRVWLCGGELKALVVGYLLSNQQVGAVSSTSGEGSWDARWATLFTNKTVYICMDVDKAGRLASLKYANYLQGVAKAVHLIKLPLDLKKFPKGDVNDYVGQCGAKVTELLKLMEDSQEWTGTGTKPAIKTDPPIEVRLVDATAQKHVGRRLSAYGAVVALETTPFLVPHDVRVACSKDQKFCHLCWVKMAEGDDTGCVPATIEATNSAVLEMVNAARQVQQQAMCDALSIPPCPVAQFQVGTWHEVRDARLSPRLEIGDQESGNVVQPAFIVNNTVEPGGIYKFTGVTHPHPRTQQATMLLDYAEEAQDGLTSFKPTDAELQALDLFRPKSWDEAALEQQLERLYQDLSSNVTGIWGRRDLHLILDLAYHSLLFLPFDGKVVNGWLNALIAGDSSQGKSEASTQLMKHYGLGERVECKNATVAGLLGGLQQMGTRWFVSWGVIPMHDRRIVILEEVKGASVEVIGRLTDMRSSGIAELPKIERRRTHARTRLIFISNPRSTRPLGSYTFGVEVVKELVGSLEDVRRFDVALLVSARDVDQGMVNRSQRERTSVPHVHTADLCRRLVLWAWTRKEDQIQFEKAAEHEILVQAGKFCDRYSEDLPLIDRGTTKFKLARLAAALAARTFSTDDSRQKLLVREAHVSWTAKFLDRLYSSKTFGYLEYSQARRTAEGLQDHQHIRKYLQSLKHAHDIVGLLLRQNELTLEDLQDAADLDRDGAQSLLSLLVRKHAVIRSDKRSYRKTSEFIALLKALEVTVVAAEAQPDEI